MRDGQQVELPRIRQLGRTLVLFWLLYAVFRSSYEIAILRAAGSAVPYASLIPRVLLSVAIWCGVSWFLFRACDFALSHRRPFARRATFLAAIAVAWAVRLALYALISGLLRMPPRFDRASLLRSMQTHAVSVGLFIVILAATAVGMRWWQRQFQAARHRAESEETLVRAELRVVAEQLEPHFLLNTLTGISVRAARDPWAAREMLSGLRELLSYSIRHGAAATVTLEDEMNFVRQYLSLQSLRFGSRLRTQIDLPTQLLDCAVPRLILQPLVENALKYGIACRAEGGQIAVEAERGFGLLVIRVRNSSAATPDCAGFGIGMAAVAARLALLFGSAQQLALTKDEGMTVVTVTMPLLEKRKRVAA